MYRSGDLCCDTYFNELFITCSFLLILNSVPLNDEVKKERNFRYTCYLTSMTIFYQMKIL